MKRVKVLLSLLQALCMCFLLGEVRGHAYSSKIKRISQWWSDYSFQTLSDAEEEERVKQWHIKYGSWPLQEFVEKEFNESPEFRAHIARREREIMQLPGKEERWENWIQFIQSRLVPKFTTNGFRLERQALSPDMMQRISNYIRTYMREKRNETAGNDNTHSNNESDSAQYSFSESDLNLLHDERFDVASIYHESGLSVKPRFFPFDGLLVQAIMDELKGLHEAWSGMELSRTGMYALRLYRGGHSLAMHLDRVPQHVISSIVHLVSDKQWPIDVENHNGALHSINLNAGDVLLYESAKCFHGRRSEFKGNYYGSLFVHYHPTNRSKWNYSLEDLSSRVPPHWCEGCESAELAEDCSPVAQDVNEKDQWVKLGLRERAKISGSRWSASALTVSSMAAAGAHTENEHTLKHHHDEVARVEF